MGLRNKAEYISVWFEVTSLPKIILLQESNVRTKRNGFFVCFWITDVVMTYVVKDTNNGTVSQLHTK